MRVAVPAREYHEKHRGINNPLTPVSCGEERQAGAQLQPRSQSATASNLLLTASVPTYGTLRVSPPTTSPQIAGLAMFTS